MMHSLLEDQVEHLQVSAIGESAAESERATKEAQRSKKLLQDILEELGGAPKQRKMKENKTVFLYLHSRNESKEFDSQG